MHWMTWRQYPPGPTSPGHIAASSGATLFRISAFHLERSSGMACTGWSVVGTEKCLSVAHPPRAAAAASAAVTH